MSEDRVKLRVLAAEWASEIGEKPDVLARALMLAAMQGDFDDLPNLHGMTFFDETKLKHFPVNRIREKVGANEKELYIQLGTVSMAWIHKAAVEVFSSTGGRNYLMPRRWAVEAMKFSENDPDYSRSGGARRNAIAQLLLELYPNGPTDYRPAMARALENRLGFVVSDTTLDRAKRIAWPPSSKVVKVRQTKA